MKIIKVCGINVSAINLGIKGSFIAACLCLLCSCASSAKIPYHQTLYKITYEFLRAAECTSDQTDQIVFAPCDRSYFQEFNAYQQLRDEFVNDVSQENTAWNPSPGSFVAN